MESVTIGKGIIFYSVVKERVAKHCRNYWKELKARSLNTPSILLLVYAASIPVCNKTLLTIADDISTPLDSPCYSNPHDNLVAYSAGTLILNALGLLFLSVVGYQILKLVVVKLFISVYGLVG